MTNTKPYVQMPKPNKTGSMKTIQNIDQALQDISQEVYRQMEQMPFMHPEPIYEIKDALLHLEMKYGSSTSEEAKKAATELCGVIVRLMVERLM